ncbi:MAG: ABC transporter permease [Lachnospiraceae bacterium]|nr:ABC transporter permease [Lachnospiraceae bacterium]
MFGSLFIKECKMWLKSIVFYAYIIILFLFYVTNMDEGTLKKPKEGRDDYEWTYSDDKKVIMNRTLEDLITDYGGDHFVTYPIGFYKEVTLSDSELKKISEYISELTGMKEEEWKAEYDKYVEGLSVSYDENGNCVKEEAVPFGIEVSDELSYDEFENIMEKVSGIIGRGSDYEPTKLKKHGMVPKTYEQALKEYEDILHEDKVTNAYARLFSDYLGIIIGILPAFFAITRVIKEKRSKVSDVIYSKKMSSTVMVLSRYASMVVMMFIPLIFVSVFALTQSLYIADAAGVSPDYFAYIKYCVLWLLPTMLFVSSLAYLITEFTKNIFAVLVSGVIWFVSLFMPLDGVFLEHVGWNYIPRFNSLGRYEAFNEMIPQLIKNRCLYSALSIIFVVLTILVYSIKRRGGIKKWKKA